MAQESQYAALEEKHDEGYSKGQKEERQRAEQEKTDIIKQEREKVKQEKRL